MSFEKSPQTQENMNQFIEHGEPIKETHRYKIYQLTEEDASDIAPNAQLHSYYLEPKNEGDNPQLQFHYDQIEGDNTKPIAAMDFAVKDEGMYQLVHRFVQEEFREAKNVGTSLLQKAEQWFQMRTQEQKKPVALGAEAGQIGVIKWLIKNGFAVEEDQQELLDEVINNPDHFTIEDIVDKDGLKKEAFIFAKDTKDRSPRAAIRLRFKKEIRPEEN